MTSERTGAPYASTWRVEESLEELNARMHDGVPVEQLADRARGYRDWLFAAFPAAAPKPGARAMELGSGVGWIMEAMLERFELAQVVGLDVSDNMVRRARERFRDDRAGFVLYDGRTMPFPNGRFDLLYSVAAMQHIEKHAAFLLFEELWRVLAAGGHAVIHLLGIDHIPAAEVSYHQECVNHVEEVPTHWHHYYSYDELFVLFAEVIGVTDLDIAYHDESASFLVHFSKATTEPFCRPELRELTFSRRSHRIVELTAADARLRRDVEALRATRTFRYSRRPRDLYAALRTQWRR